MAFVGRGEAKAQVEFSALREMEHCGLCFDNVAIRIPCRQKAAHGYTMQEKRIPTVTSFPRNDGVLKIDKQKLR